MAQGIGDAMARMFIAFGIICIVIGGLLVWLIPIVWNWVKPFIHAITA